MGRRLPRSAHFRTCRTTDLPCGTSSRRVGSGCGRRSLRGLSLSGLAIQDGGLASERAHIHVTTVKVHLSSPLGSLEDFHDSESIRRMIWRSCSAATVQTAQGRSVATAAISDVRTTL